MRLLLVASVDVDRLDQPPPEADGGVVGTADANDEPDAGEERPADCECSGHERETLPCWYCYAEGFDEPNPDAGESGD